MSGAAEGYYLMARGWMDHPAVATKEPFTWREALVWLIEKAAYRDTRQNVAGRTVVVQRGQYSTSFRRLSTAWNRPVGWVQRFLARLERERVIDTCTDTGCLLITLCNYNKYQAPNRQTNTSSDTHGDTPAIHGRYAGDSQNKEGKEGKERIPASRGGKRSRKSAAAEKPEEFPKQSDLVGGTVVPLKARRGDGKPAVPVGRLEELKAQGREFLRVHRPRIAEGRTHELMNSLALAHGGGLPGVERALEVMERWLEDRDNGKVSDALEPYLRGVIAQQKRHGHAVEPQRRAAGSGSRYGFPTIPEEDDDSPASTFAGPIIDVMAEEVG